MVTVILKWGGKVFKGVEVDTSRPVSDFKATIQELTGVPPARQKVLLGGILKDNADLSKTKLKENQVVMVVGAVDEVKAPDTKTIFLEDLTVEERNKLLKTKDDAPLPVGITNLGVTCYLNSVLQFLAAAPRFVEQLKSISIGPNTVNPDRFLATSIMTSMRQLETSDKAVIPSLAVDALRRRFPQFARKASSGMGFMQQDAEECLSCILSSTEQLQLPTGRSKEIPGAHVGTEVVDDLFGFDVECVMTCVDPAGEAPVTTVEHMRKLPIHIVKDVGQGPPIDDLYQGIRGALSETLHKHSQSLGHDTDFVKTSALHSLPEYLVVHFVRFEWKKAHELARTEATRAKITRKVLFNQNLDLYEHCSDSLKQKIQPGRDFLTELMDREAAAKPEEDETCSTPCATVTCPTGRYELLSSVTHVGRSADSGHYVGWRRADVKATANAEEWVKFDDDTVSSIPWKNMDITGGRSDYHVAFMLMFRRCTVEVEMNKRVKMSSDS
ncbi:MAG: hypothetical protein KVP17_004554 [Porospora cf. gigantea B]|uniref:uncharacterized protein n=1 Tax=Porospora cf. gigantea B TaxID=2853592 RepID=UPI003571E611|nr:MAG: hypothetical protein KVP17_004554 [Porospora cf. gigantea B]